MKKIFLLAFLFAFIGAASAQWSSGVKITQTTSDTIKTGSLTVTKYLTLTAGYSTVSIQPVVTKTSGTVLAGVKIYGTIDGTNYVLIGAVSDSLACTNQTTNTKIWSITNCPYPKIKIVGQGYGTMNALLTVWYVARKTITE